MGFSIVNHPVRDVGTAMAMEPHERCWWLQLGGYWKTMPTARNCHRYFVLARVTLFLKLNLACRNPLDDRNVSKSPKASSLHDPRFPLSKNAALRPRWQLRHERFEGWSAGHVYQGRCEGWRRSLPLHRWTDHQRKIPGLHQWPVGIRWDGMFFLGGKQILPFGKRLQFAMKNPSL